MVQIFSLSFILLLLSFSVRAELLSCKTNSRNPSHDLVLKREASGVILGSLTSTIVGYVSSSVTPLGTDPLVLTLNPATCELSLYSRNHNQNEFKLILPLNAMKMSPNGNKAFEGKSSGNILGNNSVTCAPYDSDLIKAVKSICDQNPSLDDVLIFNRTQEILAWAMKSGSVNNQMIAKDSLILKQPFVAPGFSAEEY